MTRLSLPRLLVAGLAGDSGKTLLSLGLCRALTERGLAVRAFKKGPDYIDSAWLTAASGAPCRNLDTFLMPEAAIAHSVAAAAGADLLLIEGNRGLYDGLDAAGTHSSAELAKLLAAPVLLVVNAAKLTRTAAALVLGCRELDPELNLAGVVLNNLASTRQESVVRQAVEALGVPVLGALPRLGGADPLPGRHLGLITPAEHPQRDQAIARARDVVVTHVDLERVLATASAAPPVELAGRAPEVVRRAATVGYLSDGAFSFYYPENLEQLGAAGAALVPISPLERDAVPDIDGLYVGGGFPEVYAARLAERVGFAASLRCKVAKGLPVYAECGGLMFLARELVVGSSSYPMAGVLDLVVEQRDTPQGHGYEVAVVDRDNPFHRIGTELRGHEFHYSRIAAGEERRETVLAVTRGRGVGDGRDGVVKGRVWASYLHLHALATPTWGDGFLTLAASHAAERQAADADRPMRAAWS